MLSISVLPASYGDSLWIEYGNTESPSVVLIDGGPSAPVALKQRLEKLAERNGKLELAVVTHIDADHIAGMITLLENDFYGVPVQDFWFNGFKHLPPSQHEEFGPRQGEKLTALLLAKKNQLPWNRAFDGGRISVEQVGFKPISLAGGAKITLLSPDNNQLARLHPIWEKVCSNADLYADLKPPKSDRNEIAALSGAAESTITGGAGGLEEFGNEAPDVDRLLKARFSEDSGEANGSSIAFAFEFEGSRLLCGADAYPSRLLQSLEKIAPGARHKFDAVKIPHHGSDSNVSRDFIAALDSPVYIFSSNGKRFKHPSPIAVARVVEQKASALLAFNYKTDHNKYWDDDLLKSIWKYNVAFGGDEGYRLQI